MAAYVIAQFDRVDDEPTLDRYRALAQSAVAAFGGRYLIRGGTSKAIEGNWAPHSLVVIEFADLETAHAWYTSEAYAPALAIRNAAGPPH